jgi:asparagine synthase (glutamine-hydrolysing)
LKASLKIRNGSGKWLHRRVCDRFLHPRILQRKKRGFAVNVVDGWFHSSVSGGFREMLLNESSLMFDVLKPAPVRKILEDHHSGRQDNYKLLFSLVMLEHWLRGMQSDLAGRSGRTHQYERAPAGNPLRAKLTIQL